MARKRFVLLVSACLPSRCACSCFSAHGANLLEQTRFFRGRTGRIGYLREDAGALHLMVEKEQELLTQRIGDAQHQHPACAQGLEQGGAELLVLNGSKTGVRATLCGCALCLRYP